MTETNKEIDPDLTMLNTEPTEAESLTENLTKGKPKKPTLDLSGLDVEKAVYVGPDLQSQADVKDYVTGLTQEAAMQRSTKQGGRDMDLDVGRGLYESVDSNRARNQSGGVKALKAIGGGILQGGLIAMEQAGYVGDLDTYTNLFTDTEDLSGNWWTDIMKETQDGLRQSNAFKIYDEETDSNSIASKIFKWSSLEGAISSAVGFGITGLGAAKLVSSLGAMKNFKAIAGFADEALGMAGGSTKAFVGPLATSATTNFFMGQMMAADTYKLAMEHLEGRIGDKPGMLTRFEAQKMANNEAQDVVALNMALTATAYLKFGGIFKRRRTNVMLKDPTFGRQAFDLIKKGSPTAFGENVYQEMIQMEQLHDVDTLGGTQSKDEYSSDYWTRTAELMLSNRAVHAGSLGVVGGPIQFALIQRPMMGKQLKQQKADYNTQQERLTLGKVLAQNNFDTFKKYNDAFTDAVNKGDLTESELISQSHLMHEVARQVEYGTIDSLRKDIELVRDAEEGADNVKGFDSDYKEVAIEFLDTLDKAEGYIKQHKGKANLGGIVYNRMVSVKTDKAITEVSTRAIENMTKLESLLKQKYPNRTVDLDKLAFTDKAPERFDKLSPVQVTTLKSQEAKETQNLQDFIQNRDEYKDTKQDIKRIKKFEKLSINLGKQFDYLVSPEGQKKFIEEQQDAVKGIPDALEESNKKEDVKTDAVKESRFTEFSTIKNTKPRVTAEELQTMNNDRDAAVKEHTEKGEYAQVREGKTFTSIDSEGVVRNYTEHDIVQAENGRLFRVMYQNYKGTDSKAPNMPVIKEVVMEKGRYKEASKQTVLKDNSWIKHGVLQGIVRADGKYSHHSTDWKSYRTIDTVLKPNNYAYNTRRLDNVSEGIVNSVNIHETSIGKPGFEWLNEYRMDLINKPFKEPYPVTLKLNTDRRNNTFIDVMTNTPEGEVKLTRLNRFYNLAHEDLIKALAKGDVITGMVKAHYSNRGNFSKNRDSAGNIIYTPIGKFNNLSSDLLINNSLILAQTKGANGVDNVNAARAMDGTIYKESSILIDGVHVEIPYHRMTPGDTYALIKGLNGEVTPIAFRSSNLREIPSSQGMDNKAYDVVEEWQQHVEELMQDEIADEISLDEQYKREAESSNEVNSAEEQRRLARSLKRKAATDKNKKADDVAVTEFWDSFKNSILKHIVISKRNKQKFIKGKNEDGTERTSVDGKGRPLVSPDYFKPTIAVSESTNQYVVAIEVRDELRPHRWKVINPLDNAEEFMDILEGKRSRMSMDTLFNEDIVDGAQAMQEYVDDSGLVSDVNLNNVYVGASADIQLLGDDIAYGVNEYKKLEKVREDKAPKQAIYEKDASDETISDFNDKIDTILDPDSIEISMKVVSNETTETGMVNAFQDIAASFGIKEDVSTIIKDTMEEVTEEKSQELQTIEDSLNALPLENYSQVPLMARGVLALQEIQAKVKSKELNLYTVRKATVDSKFTQAEGISEFARHEKIWSPVHGDGVVMSTTPKGTIVVRFSEKSKGVQMYPANLFKEKGAFRQLADARVKLKKARPGTIQHESATRAVNTLEARTTYLKKRAYGEENEAEKNDSGTDNSLHSLSVASDALGLHYTKNVFAKLVGNSKRAGNIAKGFDGVIEYRDKLLDVHPDGPVDVEYIKAMNDAFLDAVPYTDQDFQDMLSLLNTKIAARENVASSEQKIGHIELLRDVVKAIKDNPSPTSVIKSEATVYSLTRSKYTSKAVHIASTVAPGDRTGTIQQTGQSKLTSAYEEMIDALDVVISLETEMYADRFSTADTPSQPVKPATKSPSTSLQKERVEEVKTVLETIQNELPNIKGLSEDSKLVGLDKEFKWYVNVNDKDASGNYTKYDRVTDIFSENPDVITPKLKSSQVIGTGIDNMIRDFFDPTESSLVWNSSYAITEEVFDEFVTSLQAFKKSIAGQTVVSTGMVLFDKTTKRAGTIDLLTYDNEGAVRIYDIKTMLFDPTTDNRYEDTTIWKTVKGVFEADGVTPKRKRQKGVRDSNRIKHQKQLSAYRIILNNTYGILADKKLFVVPVKVDYSAGDTKARTARILPLVPALGLDEVGPLRLDKAKTVKPTTQTKSVRPATTKGGTVIRQNNVVGTTKSTPVTPTNKSIVQNTDTTQESQEPQGAQETLEEMGVESGAVAQFENAIAKGIITPAEAIKLTKTITLMAETDANADVNAVMNKFLDENTTPFKLASKDEVFTNEQFNDEVTQINKLLPKIPVNVVKDVAYMHKRFGAQAIGAYNQGVAYVVKGAKQGAIFHEAFHAVADLYLTPSERAEMAKERGEKEWSLELEEKFAGEFEEFQKTYKKETYADKAKKFFASIIDWFKGTRSSDVVTDVFTKIMEGGFTKTPSKTWFKASLSGIQSVNEFTKQLSPKNNVTLQSLKAKGRIKIVC